MSEVRAFLMALQDEICAAFETVDGEARFDRREEAGAGGLTRPRVLEGGPVLEKAAVNFSHSRGPALPPAATAAHPAAAGRPFEVVSLSLIAHPRNPYAPTTHMNLRYFEVAPGGHSTLERHEHVHAVMILRGHGRCLVGEQVFEVAEQDLVHIPAMIWHQFRAAEDAPLGFLCMVNTVRDRPRLPDDADLVALRSLPEVAEFIRT